MVRLNINRKRSGVPVLSRKQIDDIGERLVQDFCPDAMIHPQALDVDLFAQDYLGMEQDYQYLSHCGVYLGMTVLMTPTESWCSIPKSRKPSTSAQGLRPSLSTTPCWKRSRNIDTDSLWVTRLPDMVCFMRHILVMTETS